MTPQSLAEVIKKHHPEYRDMADHEAVYQFVKKNPQYGRYLDKTPQEASPLFQVGGALAEAVDPRSLLELGKHPIRALGALGRASIEHAKAIPSSQDFSSALEHTIGAVPIVGPGVAHTMERARGGDVWGSVGEALSFGVPGSFGAAGLLGKVRALKGKPPVTLTKSGAKLGPFSMEEYTPAQPLISPGGSLTEKPLLAETLKAAQKPQPQRFAPEGVVGPLALGHPVGVPGTMGVGQGASVPLAAYAKGKRQGYYKKSPKTPPAKSLGAGTPKGSFEYAPGELQRTPVKSSNIRSVGYDKERQIMEVEFNAGGVYQYQNVTPREFKYIKSETPSSGRYFRKKFREKTPYRKFDVEGGGYPEEWTPPKTGESGFISLRDIDFDLTPIIAGTKRFASKAGELFEHLVTPAEQILKERGFGRIVDPIENAQFKIAEAQAMGKPYAIARQEFMEPAMQLARTLAGKANVSQDIQKVVNLYFDSISGSSYMRKGPRDLGKLAAKGVYGALLGADPKLFLINLLQIGNTATRYGFFRTAKALGSLATSEGQGIVKGSGVMKGAPGMAIEPESLFQKVLHAPLTTSEYINRGSAYLAALDRAKSKGFSGSDARKQAFLGVKDTQFTYGGDSPIASIQGMKEAVPSGAMFANYPARQLNFYRTIVKDAFEGKPEARMRAARLVVILAAEIYGGRQLLEKPEYLFPILRLGGIPATEGARAMAYMYRTALGEEDLDEVLPTMAKSVAKFTVPGYRSYKTYLAPDKPRTRLSTRPRSR